MIASLSVVLDHTWCHQLDTDAVLRGQGADPAVVRARGTRLVEVAQHAVERGLPLLEGWVTERRHSIECADHLGIRVQGGGTLSGRLVVRELGSAQEIVVLAVTVGERIARLATSLMRTDPAVGLALDGLGNAAVDALANASIARVRAEALDRGWGAGVQLSPGMVGWPLERGQRDLFSLLPDDGPVRLSDMGMMSPRKSLSMVVGVGPGMIADASTCDFCSSRDRCRHRGRGC
jgi:hypothetical protein